MSSQRGWACSMGAGPTGLRLRHPGQALAPEGVIGQPVLLRLRPGQA